MKPCLFFLLVALGASLAPSIAQVDVAYGPAPRAHESITSADQNEFSRTLALVGLRAFGVNLGGGSPLVKFDLDVPGTLNTIATTVQTYAGGFDAAHSFLWAIQASPQQLVRIDTATGGATVVGPTTAQGTDIWVALKVDPVTGTLYGASTSGAASTLYTVNATTGAPTVVGTITGIPILIAMAFDNSGQLYGYDIDPAGAANSRFFRIDKQTCAGTLIGDMGFIGRFAQDMEFDRLTNRCYLAAYNLTLSGGELRTADVATGVTTLIGPLGAGTGVEIDCLGIRGLPQITVNTPVVGAVWPTGSQQTVTWTTQSLLGNVTIRLSVDGGGTFPLTLASNTANDGTEQITVPNNPSAACRVRVESASNPSFFALNPGGFTVMDQQPPTVLHSPPAIVPIASNDTVRATITDNIGVTGATLSYRKGGTATPISLAMSLVGTSYEAFIPGTAITSQGIEYFVTAQDAQGNVGRSPSAGFHSVPVQIGGEGLSKGVAQPSGSEQTAYRLVSIPFSATNATPQQVLQDDLGAYDPAKWRFFELRADQTYVEYPNTSPMNPGKSFWLVVKDAGKIVDTGPGQTNRSAGPFSVPLNSGWNFVGNPFNYTIPLSKLSLASGDTLVVRSYLGAAGWNTSPVTEIVPFEGYAVNVATATDLIINPDLSTEALQKVSSIPVISVQWSIRILARCQSAVDEDNLAQVNTAADAGLDRNDMAEPPAIGEYVTVDFPHPEWESRTTKFCVDARPPSSSGNDWTFEASSNINDKVTLTFGDIESVPPYFDVWLLDRSLKTTQNLRKTNTYGYRSSASAGPRPFDLLVGATQFVEEKLMEADALPSSFELSQNFPNPFNPTTTIRYGLPKESHVTLKVYDILGQEVATLVDEVQQQGYKAVQLPPSGAGGSSFSSGTYFYRLQAGGFTETRKLTLLK